MVLVLQQKTVSPQSLKGLRSETSCTSWTKPSRFLNQPDLYLIPQLRFLLGSNVWPPARWMSTGKGVGKLREGRHGTGLWVRGAPLKLLTKRFSEPHLGRVLRGSESHPKSPPRGWKRRIRTYHRDRQTNRKLRPRMSHSSFVFTIHSFFSHSLLLLSSFAPYSPTARPRPVPISLFQWPIGPMSRAQEGPSGARSDSYLRKWSLLKRVWGASVLRLHPVSLKWEKGACVNIFIGRKITLRFKWDGHLNALGLKINPKRCERNNECIGSTRCGEMQRQRRGIKTILFGETF